jgi:Bacteriophage HK97-gp10, putative tail-component
MVRVTVDIDSKAMLAGLQAAAKRMDLQAGLELEQLGRTVASDYQRGVGVDTGKLQRSIGIKEQGRSSSGPYVIVGSSGVDYAAAHEFGTRPHVIRSKGPWPLRNRRTGQVFGPVVHHPGTPPNPAFRRALLRASQSWRPRFR